MGDNIQPEEQGVDARTLHKIIGVGRDFSNWIKGRIAEYGFVEKQDFEVFARSGENSNGGRPSLDYALSLDMAKELAMLERTELGKQVRRYFIRCQKERDEFLTTCNPVYADQLIPTGHTTRPLISSRSQLSFRTIDPATGEAVTSLDDSNAAWDVPRGLSVNKAKQTGKAYFAELKELAMNNPMEAHSALVELFLFGWRTPMETRHRKTEKVSIGGGESVQALKKDAFAHPAVAGDCGVEWSFLDALADAALLGVK